MMSLEHLTPENWDARRTDDGKVAALDVIASVTGKSLKYATTFYNRIVEEQRVPRCESRHLAPRPANLTDSNLSPSRHGGARSKETPVAAATEMVLILWELPGSVEFRRNCARLAVRYLGGDESLVDEIYRNRATQARLAAEAPTHPARVFGEAVEAEARPAVDSEWDRRSARLAALSSAYTLASALAVPLDDTHRQAALTAINEVLLPEDRRQTDMIDAAEFLRRKGHAEDEIARMASEFGRALRTATPATSDTTRNVADFGAAMNAVRKYHCRDDALFLEEVYAAFRNRDLFINTTRQHEARRDRMYRAVHESLRGTRGFRQDRERSPRR